MWLAELRQSAETGDRLVPNEQTHPDIQNASVPCLQRVSIGSYICLDEFTFGLSSNILSPDSLPGSSVNVNGLRARLTNRTAGLAVKSKTFNFGVQSAQYVPN